MILLQFCTYVSDNSWYDAKMEMVKFGDNIKVYEKSLKFTKKNIYIIGLWHLRDVWSSVNLYPLTLESNNEGSNIFIGKSFINNILTQEYKFVPRFDLGWNLPLDYKRKKNFSLFEIPYRILYFNNYSTI